MRTTTASVLALCLTAGFAAAQEHGAAKTAASSTEDAGKAARSAKAHSAPAEQATAHAVPAAGKPAAAAKSKASVVDPPISESDRRAADAAKDAHRAVNTKPASGPEKAVPARVPVDELAIRLQRVLDNEATRKKADYAGGHAPATRAASTTRKAPLPKVPLPKVPLPKATNEPAGPGGVALNWGSAAAASHVTLKWEHDVDPREPARVVPSGARLAWEADRP